MIFDFDYAENWTTTLTRAVGPTTANARGTLPQPAPTDLNTIFVAPNGSDANPGTLALPKLTISGAFAATSGPIPTVQIVRNGFVGALAFTSGTVTVAASRNFQVEQGDTATVTFTGDFNLGQSFNCNGIEFARTGGASIILTATSAMNHVFSNCKFNIPIGGSMGFNNTVTLNYCHLREFMTVNVTASGLSFSPTFSHCIMESSSDIGSINQPISVGGNAVAVFTSTVTIDHCIVSGYPDRIVNYGLNNSTTSTIVVNATLSHIYGCQYAIGVTQSGAASQSATFSATQCLLGILTNGNTITATTIGTNAFTVTNPIDPKTPPLYVDQVAGEGGDASGFRLQWRGKMSPGGSRYFLTSPLIDIQGGSNDATPWDESTALTSTTWASSYSFQYDPQQLDYDVEFVNPQEIRDVRGNLHTNYDGIRRRITFTWSNFASPLEFKQLIRILHDRGVKRWNPIGVFGSATLPNLFIGPTNGSFNNTTRTLTFGGTADVAQNWRGYWLRFTSGGPSGDSFYIESSTATGLVLLDKLGNGYPTTASYDFEVTHLLVQTSPETISAATQYYNRWIEGQRTRAFATNIEGSHPLNGFKVTLYEVEDASEGGIS